VARQAALTARVGGRQTGIYHIQDDVVHKLRGHAGHLGLGHQSHEVSQFMGIAFYITGLFGLPCIVVESGLVGGGHADLPPVGIYTGFIVHLEMISGEGVFQFRDSVIHCFCLVILAGL
jgi:hypothetical protein